MLFLACSRDPIDRAKWQQMSNDDRVLYVQSLIGAEQAKTAKGGTAHHYNRAPQEYVAAIESAYARGDGRDPATIFQGLER